MVHTEWWEVEQLVEAAGWLEDFLRKGLLRPQQKLSVFLQPNTQSSAAHPIPNLKVPHTHKRTCKLAWGCRWFLCLSQLDVRENRPQKYEPRNRFDLKVCPSGMGRLWISTLCKMRVQARTHLDLKRVGDSSWYVDYTSSNTSPTQVLTVPFFFNGWLPLLF